MPNYKRHFLETEIDYQQRKVAKNTSGLTILYWVLIGFLLISLAVGVWIVNEAMR